MGRGRLYVALLEGNPLRAHPRLRALAHRTPSGRVHHDVDVRRVCRRTLSGSRLGGRLGGRRSPANIAEITRRTVENTPRPVRRADYRREDQ